MSQEYYQNRYQNRKCSFCNQPGHTIATCNHPTCNDVINEINTCITHLGVGLVHHNHLDFNSFEYYLNFRFKLKELKLFCIHKKIHGPNTKKEMIEFIYFDHLNHLKHFNHFSMLSCNVKPFEKSDVFEFPECPICYEKIKNVDETNAMVKMSCEHTYCSGCVQKLHQNAIDKNVNFISCPYCRFHVVELQMESMKTCEFINNVSYF